MNAESDQQYMTIKSDKKLLEIFLAGLHRMARKSLGFNPTQVEGKDVLLWGASYPTPGWVLLPGTANRVSFSGNYLNLITNEMQKLGYDADEIEAVQTNSEIDEPLTELVSEFWAEMLEYAKHNARYHSNWQTPKAA